MTSADAIERATARPHRSRREIGRDVQRERGVDGRLLEHAFVDHVLRAGEPFLAGLEHEADRARELVALGCEDARRADEHGDVRVVAARVHRPVDRARVVEAGVLGHRQRVHVGAQQDRRTGRASPQIRDHGGDGRAGVHIEAEAVERVQDESLRLRQLQPELGLGVDAPPQVDAVGQHACRHRPGVVPWRDTMPRPETTPGRHGRSGAGTARRRHAGRRPATAADTTKPAAAGRRARA